MSEASRNPDETEWHCEDTVGGAGAHEAGPKQGCTEDPSGEEEREEGEQDPVGGRGGGGPEVLEGEEGAERGRQQVDALVVVVLVREERGRAVGVLAVVVAFAAAAAAVLASSAQESPVRPLRLWLVGYAAQCLVHVALVCSDTRRGHPTARGSASDIESAGAGSDSSDADGEDDEGTEERSR